MVKRNIRLIALFLLSFLVTSSEASSNVSGAWTGSVGYDSSTGRITTDSEKPEGGSDTMYSTTLKLKMYKTGPSVLEYGFYKYWYQEQKDLNLYGQTLKGSHAWTRGNGKYLLTGVYDHYVWDGESYLEKTSLTPSYILVSGRKWVAFSLEYGRAHFLKNSGRTGSRIEGSVRVPILTGKLNRDIEAAIWHASEDINSDLYRHDETGIEIASRHDVFKHIDTLNHGIRIMRRDYDTTSSRPEDRTDTRIEYSLGISRGIEDNLQLRLDGKWIINNSNIQTEEYSKEAYTLSMIRSF
ncbi:MAG: hypothetical protein WC552_09200 [Candidatus Omnitrophota bacterium]